MLCRHYPPFLLRYMVLTTHFVQRFDDDGIFHWDDLTPVLVES